MIPLSNGCAPHMEFDNKYTKHRNFTGQKHGAVMLHEVIAAMKSVNRSKY